jgi:hypothetical protein
VDLGNSSYRWGTLYVTNINVSGSITGGGGSAGVSSINGFTGAVTLSQGNSISISGLTISVVQDVSTNGQPTFYNVTANNVVKAYQLQNSNSSAVIYSSGNIGCQDLNCNTLTNGGLTCVRQGTYVGNGVQCSAAVLGSGFGIYGQAWGWPGQNQSQQSFQVSTPSGTRTIYVWGGIITNVV